VLYANNLHTLNTIIKETGTNCKWCDIKGDLFGMKWKIRIGFWECKDIERVWQIKASTEINDKL